MDSSDSADSSAYFDACSRTSILPPALMGDAGTLQAITICVRSFLRMNACSVIADNEYNAGAVMISTRDHRSSARHKQRTGRFRQAFAWLAGIWIFTSACVAVERTPDLEALDTLLRHGFENCAAEPQRISFAGANQHAIEGWFWRSRCAQKSNAPAVVMLHGCSGVYASNGYGDESHISSRFVNWADDLTHAGMHVVLVDSFSTRDPDDPPQTSRQNYCNARADIVAIQATEESDRPQDAVGGYFALLALENDEGQSIVDADRVGLLGWSHGGSAALATAARNHWPLQPFVTAQVFYPGCGMYGAFGNPGNGTSTYVADVPIDLHIGTDDTVSSIAACSAHAQHSSDTAGARMEVHPWSHAMHSFDGASCVKDTEGLLMSPWTQLRYTCTGTYNGEPFTLHDWMARLNARRMAICAFREALNTRDHFACPGEMIYP